jgi:hypothetical protein
LIASLFLVNSVNAQITVVNSQTNTSTGTTLTISKPTNLAVGDLMIANITQRDNQNVATSSGWILVASYQVGTNNRFATILYKVATADLDVTVSSFTFSVGGSAEIAGITAFRSVDTATTGGIEVTGAAVSVNSTGPIVPGEIITLTNNALVLFLGQISGTGFPLPLATGRSEGAQ